MRFGPTRDKSHEGIARPKPLEEIGAAGANPWEVVARHSSPGASGNKRRNYAVAGIGATPPRDGPWADPAQAIAGLLPTKARTRRQAGAIWPPVTGNRGNR